MKLKIVAYTGSPIYSFFWGEVIIDIKGIAAKAPMPLLRSHDHLRIAGKVTRTSKNNQGLLAEADVSETIEDGKAVAALLREEIPLQASVGVWARDIQELEKGESDWVNGQQVEGPMIIWRQSAVREISVVALGADPFTKVNKLAAAGATGMIRPSRVEPASEIEGQQRLDADVRLNAEVVRLMGAEKLTVDEAFDRVELENPELVAEYMGFGDGSSSEADLKLNHEIARLMNTEKLTIDQACNRIELQKPELLRGYMASLGGSANESESVADVELAKLMQEKDLETIEREHPELVTAYFQALCDEADDLD